MNYDDGKKTNNTLIKVEGLKLAYGSHLVLENINFEVEQGRCLVVMGGSGCGKSTLLKSMVGLLPPVNGKVVLMVKIYGVIKLPKIILS